MKSFIVQETNAGIYIIHSFNHGLGNFGSVFRFVHPTIWVYETYILHHLNGKTTLCTTDLHCAPPTCIVHHGAQGRTKSVSFIVHKTILYVHDGAQYDIVSLAVWVYWSCIVHQEKHHDT